MRHIARQPRGEIRGQDTYCSKFSCLALNGPIDQLRTNYSSDPSLPAADIINLLSLYLAYCLVLVSPWASALSLFRSQRLYRIGAHRSKCGKIQSDQ